MVFFNRNNHRVDRVTGFLSSHPNWLPPPPHPPPETHILRQAGLHDCLPGCWAMGTHKLKKCTVMKKYYELG
jgi:hypothetical protein